MAGRLMLIFIICFFHELNVLALLQPVLTVNRHVITEKDSVTLSCQTPPSVTVSQCYFIVKAENTSSVSCVQNLTAAELLKMAVRSQPAEVRVTCLYTVMIDALKSTSPESDQTTIIINNLLPPQLTVDPLVITETDSVTLNCQTPSHVLDCYFIIMRQKPAKGFPCLKTLMGTELLSLTHQSSPAHVEVTCYYLESNQSPESLMSTIIIGLPQPVLTVNPPVITQTDSVTLNCQTPSVSQCHLYVMRTKMSRVVSCQQTFTGSELLFMTLQRPPAEAEVRCFYTVEKRAGGEFRSPQSDTFSISVRNLSPPTSTVETATSQQTMTSGHVESTTQTRQALSVTTVARQSDTALTHAPTTSVSPARGDAITDQTVKDLSSTTATTPQQVKWMLKLFVAVIGCGVALGVILMGVVLLCPNRRSEHKMMFSKRSHGNTTGDLYCMVNYEGQFPAANQLVHNMISSVPTADISTESHEMVPGPVSLTEYEPLNGQDPENVDSDTYHVYSSISDEPPVPTSDGYSTLQAFLINP